MLAASLAACGEADEETRPARGPSADQPAAAAAAETVAIGPLQLALAAGADGCRVVSSTAAERPIAGVGTPCFFLRRSGKIQRLAYPAAGVDTVLMLGGGAISDEQRRHWGLGPNEVCGTHAQGLLVSGDKVKLSDIVLTEGVFCRNHGIDEKEFGRAAGLR